MTVDRSTVLIVDDYADTLEMWALYLEACGYSVLKCGDGLQAVEIATKQRPDAIVMDLDLPGISGLEAARRLRAQPTTEAIPIIAATGHTGAVDSHEINECGFRAILIKPCGPDMLVHEIQRAMTGRDASGNALTQKE